MIYSEAIYIIVISFLTALMAEGLSWLMTYRTKGYKSLAKDIDALNAKLEKAKDRIVGVSSKKTKDKQVAFYEETLKLKSRDLTIFKMKSGAVIMVIMFSVLAYLNNQFDGRVVAKLPFTPIPLITGITHRNLPGSDYTDCSMTFLYVLCSMSFRANIHKALGFTSPKTATSFFSMPSDK